MPGVFLVPAMLLTLVAYGLERLVFLFWNLREFHDAAPRDFALALLAGIRFDASAVAFISAPIVVLSWVLLPWRHSRRLQGALLWVFFAIQAAFQGFNGIDTELVDFVGRRLTTETFFILGEAQGKMASMIRPIVGIAIPFFLIFFLWIFFSRRIVFSDAWQRLMNTARPATQAGAQLLLICGLVIAARGGVQPKPLGFAHAQIFRQPPMNNLALNSAFTVIQSARRVALPREHYFDDRAEMLRYLNGAVTAPSLLDGHRPAQPQNVVVIILESFNFEYMGAPHGDSGATPFLDELAKKSLFFTNAYANGRRSIEGVTAVLAGVPSMMAEPFISSQYLTNHLWGVGSILSNVHYHTSFFHGAHNGSMFFDQFMQRIGVKEYYGFNEFPDKSEDDGTWGIWDEPMLQWTARKYSSFQQPFFSAIFTLTSHHPYTVPKAYESLPKGDLDILQSIRYTDLSLRKFFAYAATQPWYDHTLFILSADHTHQSYRPEYQNEIGRYRIPIIVFHPTFALPRVDTDQVVSQIDILPTILDFVGVDLREQNYLGRSLFVPGPRSAITYLEGKYQLMKGDYFMEYNRGGAFTMFARTDPFEQHPLGEPTATFDDLERTLKASIQYFSEGLWDNRLYYPTVSNTGKH